MRCPTLNELPPAPLRQTGWPWTEESPQLPDTMSRGRSWPRVSIVTPSYNQAQFIEETIRSVLLQGYPDLEYLIIDGGSTDGCVDVIRKYERWLAYWVSEPDRGQAQAINKGLQRATGEILAWLNSDDAYLSKALGHVANTFRQLPEVGWVFGSATFVDEDSRPIGVYRGVDKPFFRKLQYWRGWEVPQPGLLFRRDVYDEIGGLDEGFRYALDYEWILRVCSKGISSCCSDTLLATYRRHTRSKTGNWAASKSLFHRECARAVLRYAPRGSWLLWRLQVAKLAYEIRWCLSRANCAVRSALSMRS